MTGDKPFRAGSSSAVMIPAALAQMTASLLPAQHCGVSPNECSIVRACIGTSQASALRLSQNIHTFDISSAVGASGLILTYSRTPVSKISAFLILMSIISLHYVAKNATIIPKSTKTGGSRSQASGGRMARSAEGARRGIAGRAGAFPVGPTRCRWITDPAEPGRGAPESL